MLTQRVVRRVLVAPRGGVLDGAVHPLDLAVGPGVVRPRETVLDVVAAIGEVERMLTAPWRRVHRGNSLWPERFPAEKR